MKIRMDFVTNSSSSSFVTFGIISPELEAFIQEMDRDGKVEHWGDGSIRGPEACSGIENRNGVINITRDVFEFYSNPNSLRVCDEDLDYWDYNDNKKYINSDAKKILKYEEAYKAISDCFNKLSHEQELKLKDIIKRVFEDHKIDCLIFKDMTDGFCGQYFSLRSLNKRLEEKYGRSGKGKKTETILSEYIKSHTVQMSDDLVKGKTICIQNGGGYSEQYFNRFKSIAQNLGGKVTKSISGSTDFEIISDDYKDLKKIDTDFVDAMVRNLSIYNEKRAAKGKSERLIIFDSDFMNWMKNK